MRFPFSRFVVLDQSMEPAFFEGDHVLTFNWFKPKVGEAVVVGIKGRNLIKNLSVIRKNLKKLLKNHLLPKGK